MQLFDQLSAIHSIILKYDNIVISVMLVLAFVGKMANPLKEVVSIPLPTT